MARSPVGAVVRYHGSHHDAHGEYVVFGACTCPDCGGLVEALGSNDLPIAVLKRMRYKLGRIDAALGPDRELEHVRRSSFTVINAAEDSVH